MTQVTMENLKDFLNARPLAVIQIDADWDAKLRETARRMMQQAMTELGDQASFGEVDCDVQPNYCRSIEVANVPCIAYYRDGKFVTQIVGASQDIASVLHRMSSDPMATPKSLREVAHRLGT